MDGVVPLTIALIILILLSAFFSATETAFSCINRIRIKSWSNKGNKRARLILGLADNYDKLITNILIGNNIVNITAASLATVLFTKLLDASLATIISTIVMTLAVLIFGEIIPKTLAKKYPESFAMFVGPIIYGISLLLYPISLPFFGLQKLLNLIFKPKNNNGATNEELITIINEAQHEGALDEEDSTLIKSAIEFNNVEVDKILTPRVDVIAIRRNAPMEEIVEVFRESGYSRLPIFEDTIDNIIGFIHEKDFFLALHDGEQNIEKIIQDVYCISPQVDVSTLLKELQNNKEHLAVVVDEFGGTEGIVTMEDCLEELVGEIYDESDEVIGMFKKLNDNTYIVNGNADVEDTFELLKFKPNEEYESNTIGGWTLETIGHTPEKGFLFTYKNLTIQILKMEFRRIRSLRIHAEPIIEEKK